MLRKMTTFYYFGFGSNLLEKRIKIQNKSAVRVGVGKLNDFILDFADATADEKYYSKTWNGCPATIIEHAGSAVFGAVWKIETKDLEELDRQEGVELGIYKPMEVKVLLNQDKEISCRTYQLVHNPQEPLDPQNRCFERQPSKTYLQSFKHNGNAAINTELVEKLNLKDFL
jgi:gamma-glutamylcyclotransferase